MATPSEYYLGLEDALAGALLREEQLQAKVGRLDKANANLKVKNKRLKSKLENYCCPYCGQP